MRCPMCTMRRGLRVAGGVAAADRRHCRRLPCAGSLHANTRRLLPRRRAPPPTRSRCCRAMASALRSRPWPSRWVQDHAALLPGMTCSVHRWWQCLSQLRSWFRLELLLLELLGLAKILAQLTGPTYRRRGTPPSQALTAAGKAEGEDFVYTEAPIGGAAIDGASECITYSSCCELQLALRKIAPFGGAASD